MRKEQAEPGQRGRVKFRIVEFELDGNNATLQDSIRAISSAMNRNGISQPLLSKGVGASAHIVPPESRAATVTVDTDETVEEQASLPIEAAEGQESSSKRTGPRKFPTPEVLPMSESEIKSFKEFCSKKAPTTDTKKYSVIAAWYKEMKDVSEVTIDHIYTCYKLMGWGVQKDLGSPLRNLKMQGWFDKGKTKGAYAINHIGLDVVTQMGKS